MSIRTGAVIVVALFTMGCGSTSQPEVGGVKEVTLHLPGMNKRLNIL